jgi:hypothetical protein
MLQSGHVALMYNRRHHRFASAALIVYLIAGYAIFATDGATCLDHGVGSHHHAMPTAHHHSMCGETQCSAAAIVTDGLSAPTNLLRVCGTVVSPAVAPVDLVFLSFASSRAPPPSFS